MPLLTVIVSVVGKITCFSSLSEVSTGQVALVTSCQKYAVLKSSNRLDIRGLSKIYTREIHVHTHISRISLLLFLSLGSLGLSVTNG